MKRWLALQLRSALEEPDSTVLVLDPEGALSQEDLADLDFQTELLQATDWRSLRRVWDLDLSLRPVPGKTLLLLQRTEFPDQHPLPWDIEQACRVVTVRWPVPAGLRDIYSEAVDLSDTLVDAWLETGAEAAAVARVFEVQFGGPTQELEAIANLVTRYDTPPSLWPFLAHHFQSQLAQRVASAGGDLAPLQVAWKSWLAGQGEPALNIEIVASPGPILRLLSAGRLLPESCQAAGLPEWTRLGTKDAPPSTVVEELLGKQPPTPKTFEDWAQVATWWGQIRYLCSTGEMPSHLQATVTLVWGELDTAFQSWLRARYGQELMSSSARPKALNRVSEFLFRRVEAGSKVLLIVLDGLAFAQWHQIQQTTDIHVQSTSACLAMIPTLTEVSRQAIFAGAYPYEFQETLTTTRAEEKRWRSWWNKKGVSDDQVTYLRVKGDQPIEPPSSQTRAGAIVISAIDDLLHDSNLFGDAQLHKTLELWLSKGILVDLIRNSVASGFEVWVTSDHGNLECSAAPVPNQGDLTDRTGQRVITFPNEVLRDAVITYGVAWRPPGFPDGKIYPLFATGRNGFHRAGVKVIHGGLSLDEVMVPLAQVTA